MDWQIKNQIGDALARKDAKWLAETLKKHYEVTTLGKFPTWERFVGRDSEEIVNAIALGLAQRQHHELFGALLKQGPHLNIPNLPISKEMRILDQLEAFKKLEYAAVVRSRGGKIDSFIKFIMEKRNALATAFNEKAAPDHIRQALEDHDWTQEMLNIYALLAFQVVINSGNSSLAKQILEAFSEADVSNNTYNTLQQSATGLQQFEISALIRDHLKNQAEIDSGGAVATLDLGELPDTTFD